MRGWIALAFVTGCAFAQSGVPTIAREGLTQWPDGRAKLISPGMIMTFYGANLGPEPWCNQPIPVNGPYPVEACGVRVLVDGRPAGLMFVGAKQTNFKIPEEAPEDGAAPIEVCVRDACSDPVVFRFSLHKAFLHLLGHAYVHMPVWIEIEQPWGDIRYPYSIFLLNFGGAELEMFHNGEPVAPFRTSIATPSGGTSAPKDSPSGRLPLHLLYRFDEPGVYSVRFTGRGYKYPGATEVKTQSDWTDIVVEPYTAAQRLAWLESEAAKARTATVGELVGDVIPSLVADPDEAALSVLLTLVDHPDGMVRQYARMSLDFFDEQVQKRVIPANRWQDLHQRAFSILG
jgi:hypothetical protein